MYEKKNGENVDYNGVCVLPSNTWQTYKLMRNKYRASLCLQ